jgi:hypothetical protein
MGCSYIGSTVNLVELCRVFQNEFHNGIPNVAVWRVLRKCLHLKAYKLSVVQHLNTRYTVTFGILL